MSDVQPILYIEDLEQGMAFYREQLGLNVSVFGHHKQTGAPLIAAAKLEDAVVLLTREELFRDEGSTGSGTARL